MFDLVFLFTGLTVFALDTPTSPANRLDVVLVEDADHEAMLLVAKDQVTSATNLPTPRSFGAGGTHYGFPIEGRIVRVLGQTGELVWSPRTSDDACPDRFDRESFGWVMALNRMAPGKGQVLPSMRNPSPLSPPPEVSAKIELEAGILRTMGFARTKDNGSPTGDRVLLWRFDAGTVTETAAADLVEVRQEGLDEDIVLELARIDGKGSGQLSLAANGKSEILVEIVNQPEKTICCHPRDILAIAAINTHFCHLMDVLPPGSACKEPIAVDYCSHLAPDPTYAGWCADICAQLIGNPQCPGGDGTTP